MLRSERRLMIPHERPTKILRRELVTGDISTFTNADLKWVRHNIQYARSKLRPVLPKTLSKLHSALKHYNVRTNRDENFLYLNDKINNVVAFSCDTNLTFLRQVKTIFVDGTFKACPKLFYQIFTIHAVKDNVYIPLVFFLLPDKSTVSYVHAFRSVEEYLSPDTVYADFEKAIHTAVGEVWFTALLKGCRFHIAQAWWR